jgi:YggT family protein
MDIILIPCLVLLSAVIGIYSWIVIAAVVVSWLINFNVINVTNKFVMMLVEFLYRATEPVLKKIRRFLPPMGGFDLSPVALILFLWFVQLIIGRLMFRIG